MIHAVTAKTMITLHRKLVRAVIRYPISLSSEQAFDTNIDRAPMAFFAATDSADTINR